MRSEAHLFLTKASASPSPGESEELQRQKFWGPGGKVFSMGHSRERLMLEAESGDQFPTVICLWGTRAKGWRVERQPAQPGPCPAPGPDGYSRVSHHSLPTGSQAGAIFALWHQHSASRSHIVKLVSWIETSEMMYLVVSPDLVLMALQFGYSPRCH